MTGARRRGHLALLAIVLTLPSCLTAHMWATYEPDWQDTHSSFHDQKMQRRGRLSVMTSGPAGSRLSLTWNRDEASAEVTGSLALTPADHRSHCLETVIASPATSLIGAELRSEIAEFHGSIRQWTMIATRYTLLAGKGGEVVTGGVPMRLTRQMQPLELSLLSKNSGIANLRQLMAHCVGLSSDWQLDAWQITDQDLQPVAEATTDNLSRELADDHLVVGRFRSARGITYGVVPASMAALIANSKVVDAASGTCLYKSRWHAALPSNDADGKSIATLENVEERITHTSEHRWHELAIDDGFFVRVAATPVTLACDILLGPGLDELWKALTRKRRSQPEPEIERQQNN